MSYGLPFCLGVSLFLSLSLTSAPPCIVLHFSMSVLHLFVYIWLACCNCFIYWRVFVYLAALWLYMLILQHALRVNVEVRQGIEPEGGGGEGCPPPSKSAWRASVIIRNPSLRLNRRPQKNLFRPHQRASESASSQSLRR